MKKYEAIEAIGFLASVIESLVLLDKLAFDESDATGVALDNIKNIISDLKIDLTRKVHILYDRYDIRLPKMRDYT